MNTLEFKIEKKIAILSESNGYTKELNIVSFGEHKPKYDLRRWHNDPEEGKIPLKGIQLTVEELHTLKQAVTDLE